MLQSACAVPALLSLVSRAALAQCPDGTPPPCRSALAGRTPNLPLNDNLWLVLPFENTARATDAELIRQASVSQLGGEMSRWAGVRVVSDDRVADLLHQLPEARRERPGLEASLVLARRAGAGKIVLGGYLAAGGRANVTAKVYETRSGREVRTVREPINGFQTAAALDSLTASFGRLARGILDVPAGSGTAASGVGTSSIEAYRAFVAGMDALNRLDVDSANARFDRAIRLDSNYAMAHLKRYRASIDTTARRVHLAAALRLASSLPPRERALVEGADAENRGNRERLCAIATELVGADSNDVEGLAQLSACYRDMRVVLESGTPRLRGDLNRAIRAAERAYALAPEALSSQIAIINSLPIGSFIQCVPLPASGLCPPEDSYRISVLPSGDSIAVVIRSWADVKHAPPDLAPAAVAAQSARFRRTAAVADRMAVTSGTRIANYLAAQFAQAAGDLDDAEAHLGRGTIGPLDTVVVNRTQYLQTRFEVALARERPAEFQAYADSLAARPGNGLTTPYRAMLGHLGEGLDTNATGRLYAAWRPILAGIVPPGFDTLEQQITTQLTDPRRADFLQLSTLAGFHMRHSGPALDTAAVHPLKRYQAWFARGEVARARAALTEFDRGLMARHPNTPDDGGWLFSAESHLELGDSAIALQRMQEFARRWPTCIVGASILEMRYFQSTTPRLWGRTWLLYGDLSLAAGQEAAARRAYRMVVGLWEHGESPVMPMVERARAALARLGS